MRVNLSRMVSAWWVVVTGLLSDLVAVVGTSYAAGQRLAVLTKLEPALEQLQAHETRIAVLEAACCSERIQPAVRTSQPTPTSPGLLWALGDTP